jgi:hypothetical protein
VTKTTIIKTRNHNDVINIIVLDGYRIFFGNAERIGVILIEEAKERDEQK